MTRNVLCPRYKTCLEITARRNRSFDCGRCRLRRASLPDHERHLLLWSELDGCALLLVALFAPATYEAFNQIRNSEPKPPGGADVKSPEMPACPCLRPGEIVEPGASP